MASLKYGCISGSVETRVYPVAASQYFRHDGVNAVFFDANGRIEVAVSTTATLAGIAIPPKGRGAGTSDSYWKSSATAGADEIAVIVDPEAKYLLPADATATEAMRGNACDLLAVNDGTATYVDVGESTTDVFIIVDAGTNYGGTTTDVVVKINPIKFQAD